MKSINIWAARQTGVDPTTHFWFRPFGEGLPHRMCDGSTWAEGHETGHERVPFVPCSLCKETYLADVLHERKVLTISLEGPFPADFGHIPVEMGQTPIEHGPLIYQNGIQKSGMEGGLVPVQRVSVYNFAKFCEARPDRQQAVVRQIRKRTLNPNAGFDYYGPLKGLIRRTHWATNNLATFEDALPAFLSGQKKPDMADNYRRMAEAYVDYWNFRATDFIPVDPGHADHQIEDLTIRVNPEVGMRTRDGDRQILKLWFNRISPTRQTRLIIGHLMDKVTPNAQWLSGIWDIRGRNIPLPVVPTDGFDLVLAGQAAAFQHIWEGLDDEAEQLLD